MELLQALGLAGRVQLELKRQRWLADVVGSVESLSEAELAAQVQVYLADLGLHAPAAVQQWMLQEGVGEAELVTRARRHHLWLQVCEQHFGKKLASYFLQRKKDLDEVTYTVLPIAEQELCSELYMQIKEGEISFEALLQQLPAQPDLGPRGEQGPVALSELPEGLAQLLRVSQPGQLWPPKPIQQGWILVRLEESKPAILDQQMRRRLLLELGYQLLNQDVIPPESRQVL
jgi:parvulin-like peptidyl-prolyl isomerase